MSDARRIEDLEFKLAHLERGLQELSDEVLRQQQDIERLRRENARLAEQVAAATPQDADAATRVEIPPHY
jgi:uncharacterized coiled-coil protein SlyX